MSQTFTACLCCCSYISLLFLNMSLKTSFRSPLTNRIWRSVHFPRTWPSSISKVDQWGGCFWPFSTERLRKMSVSEVFRAASMILKVSISLPRLYLLLCHLFYLGRRKRKQSWKRDIVEGHILPKLDGHCAKNENEREAGPVEDNAHGCSIWEHFVIKKVRDDTIEERCWQVSKKIVCQCGNRISGSSSLRFDRV